MTTLVITAIRARKLVAMDPPGPTNSFAKGGSSDPFAEVRHKAMPVGCLQYQNSSDAPVNIDYRE